MFKNHNAKKINNNEKIKHFNFIYTSVGHSKNHGSKPALNQHKYFINCSGINTYYFMLSNAYREREILTLTVRTGETRMLMLWSAS